MSDILKDLECNVIMSKESQEYCKKQLMEDYPEDTCEVTHQIRLPHYGRRVRIESDTDDDGFFMVKITLMKKVKE